MYILISGMRTTIELSDAHRARLLALAAERGEKGFSGLIGEALDRYLAEIDAAERAAEMRRGLEAVGRLPDEVAERLEATFGELRRSWR